MKYEIEPNGHVRITDDDDSNKNNGYSIVIVICIFIVIVIAIALVFFIRRTQKNNETYSSSAIVSENSTYTNTDNAVYDNNDSSDNASNFEIISSYEEENADYKYGTINTIKDPLNVRKQPSVDAEKIGSVQKGTTITIIGDTDEWYEIIYGDQIGYVSKLYVALENETRSEVAITGVVITKKDPLNVREQPNTNAKILGTVPKGGAVSIIKDDGEWYEIQYGSGTGYVSKKYVSLT